jgi:hypothetical protein
MTMATSSWTGRPDIRGALFGLLFDSPDPTADDTPEPPPAPVGREYGFGNYPAGLSPCFAAGISGDAAEGCPYAGEDFCDCDKD